MDDRSRQVNPTSPGDEFAALQARHDRLTLLYQVSNVIHSTLDPQQALQLIVDQAVRVVRASSGSIALVNPTTGFLEIVAAQGLPPRADALRLRLGEGITGWVARQGKTARVSHVAQDPRYVMLRPEVQSEMAVPLEVKDEVRGVLNVDSDKPGAFSAEDEDLLEALAVQAAQVIHHTWLYEQLRLKVRLFESLASISQTINSTMNLGDALDVVTREACQLMQGKMCSLLMLDPSGDWLELRSSHGAGPDYQRKPKLSVPESLLGIVVRRKKPVQVENVQVSGVYQHVDIARREGLVSLLSVPLLYTGKAIGTLNVYKGAPYSFSNEEIRILSALAELSAIAIQKAQLYERLVDVEEQLRRNEKLSALGLLAAEVAHEIRNPLTVMKMLYHSLELRFPQNDPRAKDARIIEEKMEHLNRIVEHILDFARTAEPRMSPVNLNQLVEELGLLVRHKLKQQGIEFVLHLAPSLPLVKGDAPQLEQAFLNLILNAAEAMPSGGSLTISTRAAHTGDAPSDTVLVEFADTGPGMTEEQRQRAFASLLRTTKEKGTGLGLAIVSRVAEAHRGRLEIHSELGHGTRVTFLLPHEKPARTA